MYGPGFLGRNATFGGDLNLLTQLSLGVLLLVGMLLARRRHYRVHAACQTTALALSLVLTAAWMAPAFRDVYAPSLGRAALNRVTLAVALHAGLGSAVLLLGIWIVLVAATPLVPERLRFSNYRRWMRTLLALWWVVIGLGTLTYWLTTG